MRKKKKENLAFPTLPKQVNQNHSRQTMILCPDCKTLLTLATSGDQEKIICPTCRKHFYFKLFPALLTDHETTSGQAKITGKESSCYYHANKIAVRSCDYCGRFLCALCEIPVNNQHICPTCMAKGKEAKATDSELKNHPLPDSIALSIAILPIIFLPATVITAPFTIFYIFKNYRKFHGIIPRSRWRHWLAGIVATTQLALWFVIPLYFLD